MGLYTTYGNGRFPHEHFRALVPDGRNCDDVIYVVISDVSSFHLKSTQQVVFQELYGVGKDCDSRHTLARYVVNSSLQVQCLNLKQNHQIM